MKHEILYPGTFPLLKVALAQGESIKAESDAMVSMSSTIDVEGKEEQCVYVCFDSNENACVFRVGENKYAFLPNDPVEKHVVKKKKRK